MIRIYLFNQVNLVSHNFNFNDVLTILGLGICTYAPYFLWEYLQYTILKLFTKRRAMAEENHCMYFVRRKRRYCRMTVKKGKKYCGEHQNVSSELNCPEALENKRITCPLDPTQ